MLPEVAFSPVGSRQRRLEAGAVRCHVLPRPRGSPRTASAGGQHLHAPAPCPRLRCLQVADKSQGKKAAVGGTCPPVVSAWCRRQQEEGLE